MGTLLEEIKDASQAIMNALASNGCPMDYSLDSLIEIDCFFVANMKDGKPRPGSVLSRDAADSVLFSLGAYTGETIIKIIPGAEWAIDEEADGLSKISIILPDQSIIWPIERVVKRFWQGEEDSIYPYGYALVKKFKDIPFNEKFWEQTRALEPKKPWWKFW